MRSKLAFVFLAFILVVVLANLPKNKLPEVAAPATSPWWDFQAIDTMKYSRDPAREKGNDASFDDTIDQMVSDIAAVGATHVGIATPYDEEFVPYLTRWVTAARKYKLKVWFRGNWSGWEEWFGYPEITRAEHLAKTKQFILDHGDLFEDGDVFSGCPECENGGPGDPRKIGDVAGYRNFLIAEYAAARDAFRLIGKSVSANFNSMNADVARLVMDKQTTQSLGGFVVIDHYVESSEDLASDIESISKKSEGQIILGEFGAPIPDIHGSLDEKQQAAWIDKTLDLLIKEPSLEGLSYWVNRGGSTKLWNDDGTPREAATVLAKYFKPRVFYGRVVDQFENPLEGVKIKGIDKQVVSNRDGIFYLPYIHTGIFTFQKNGFVDQQGVTTGSAVEIIMQPTNKNVVYKLREELETFLNVFRFR